MSKLAHSNDETMAIIERQSDDRDESLHERLAFKERQRLAAAQSADAPALYVALCDILDCAADGDPRNHPHWNARYAAAVTAIQRAESLAVRIVGRVR